MNHQTSFTEFTLPCGLQLKNRLVKAAMEENLADDKHLPTEQLTRLYQTWAQGGVGLIITGNVMVDHLAKTGPGGVALEQDTPLEVFKNWATAAKQNNTKVWMQINHPGRQVFKRMGGKVLSPSDVAIDLGAHSNLFPQPTPMTEDDIQEVIARFVTTSVRAEAAGFDGVQIHAAHGYLLAQFLSPLTNKRDDQWGGSLENRARLLISIVKQVRQAVQPEFAVTVKLNSADFQKGGFDANDAEAVVKLLSGLGVDVVELSGGSYESPAMQGNTADKSTLGREAYFLEFARNIAKVADMPIMTTGGIRRLDICEQVLRSGVDLVGLARALSFHPNLPTLWQTEWQKVGVIPRVNWDDKTLSGLAVMAMIKRNLRRISKGRKPLLSPRPMISLLLEQFRQTQLTKRYSKMIANEYDNADQSKR